METIFWVSVALLIIAAFAVGYIVRKHNKLFGKEPVPVDDPGHYDDVEYCEQPFIEYFN
jgi:hypothetical protein